MALLPSGGGSGGAISKSPGCLFRHHQEPSAVRSLRGCAMGGVLSVFPAHGTSRDPRQPQPIPRCRFLPMSALYSAYTLLDLAEGHVAGEQRCSGKKFDCTFLGASPDLAPTSPHGDTRQNSTTSALIAGLGFAGGGVAGRIEKATSGPPTYPWTQSDHTGRARFLIGPPAGTRRVHGPNDLGASDQQGLTMRPVPAEQRGTGSSADGLSPSIP